jgi:hypothetical protein
VKVSENTAAYFSSALIKAVKSFMVHVSVWHHDTQHKDIQHHNKKMRHSA